MSHMRISARPRSVSFQKVLANRLSLRVLAPLRPLSSTSTHPFQPGPPMDWSTHSCDIDAEPLHRYHKGGYHPIHLGDSLSSGRYKILHKLGWGSYSTVWAARDTRSCYLRYMDTAHADVLLGHKRMLLSKYRYPNQTTRAKKSASYVP
jgi:hypothetical protein